jgi:hypothetical protein
MQKSRITMLVNFSELLRLVELFVIEGAQILDVLHHVAKMFIVLSHTIDLWISTCVEGW